MYIAAEETARHPLQVTELGMRFLGFIAGVKQSKP